MPWSTTPPDHSNSAYSESRIVDVGGHVSAECCGRATRCGTSKRNACEEVDKLYVPLAENLPSEAYETEC